MGRLIISTAMSADGATEVGDWFVQGGEDDAAGREYLSQAEAMPIEPITPSPPPPDGCYGDPDDVDCSFDYPGLDLGLDFNVLRYSTGLRLVTVRCYETNTGNPVKGGISACARAVRNS